MEVLSKQQIIEDLNKAFSDTVSWYESQPDENFNKELVVGKWTMAGHLYHLIKTAKAISGGMGMPKLVLKMTFGTNNRTERTFEEQRKKYKDKLAEIASQSGVSAQPGSEYVPTPGKQYDKAALIKRLQEEKKSLLKNFEKHSEKDLGKYLLPHPLIGKMTLREMSYFAVFHTYHHLDSLKENYQI